MFYNVRTAVPASKLLTVWQKGCNSVIQGMMFVASMSKKGGGEESKE